MTFTFSRRRFGIGRRRPARAPRRCAADARARSAAALAPSLRCRSSGALLVWAFARRLLFLEFFQRQLQLADHVVELLRRPAEGQPAQGAICSFSVSISLGIREPAVKTALVNCEPWSVLIKDLGPAETRQRLVKDVDAERNVHRIRQPPGQHPLAQLMIGTR